MWKFILAIACLIFIRINNCEGQNSGDFRSRVSSDWSSANTWQRFNGAVWENAGFGLNDPGQTPDFSSSVFIQSGHSVNLSMNVACKDLNISNGTGGTISDAFAGKVSIGTNKLSIYGKIRSFNAMVGVIPGTDYAGFSSYPFSVNSGGKLSIEGNSRVLTYANQWNTIVVNPSSGAFPLEININQGETITIQTGVKLTSLVINTGIVDVGLNNNILIDNGGSGQGDVVINAQGTLISSNSGAAHPIFSRTESSCAGNFSLFGKLSLSGSMPEIQFSTINISIGSTVEFSGSSQRFLNSSFLGAVSISQYGNIKLSGSGSKTPISSLTISNNLSIEGAAIFSLGNNTLNIGGDWTNYNTIGFTESSSAVDFNGVGTQTITTIGGEDFCKLKKSGTGTLVFNADVRLSGSTSEFNITSGIIKAGVFTFSGTSSTTFKMQSGILQMGKTGVTLPEFPSATYQISGGMIELNGSGVQVLRGARGYFDLKFSGYSFSTLSSAASSIGGTIYITGFATVNALSYNLGGTGTNLSMDGGRLILGVGGIQPAMAGNYMITGGTIEYAGTSAKTIRSPLTYYAIEVSGVNVGNSLGNITLRDGGSFTVKATGTFSINADNITCPSGTAYVKVENGGVFNCGTTEGFNGYTATSFPSRSSAVSANINNISLGLTSIINYCRAGNQPITNANSLAYGHVTLSSSGIKSAPSSTLIIKGNLTRTEQAFFAHNNGLVSLNGTSQTFSGINFFGLELGGGSKTTDGNSTITDLLQINSDAALILKASDTITLLSRNNKTARLGQLLHSIPDDAIVYNSNSRFRVERFISSGRKWRFLSSPTIGQTIKQAWQENASAGQDIQPGFGFLIGKNESNWSTLGFDLYSAAPTVKTYNSESNNWMGINNTNENLMPQKSYMSFVFGNRSGISGTSTILRSTGYLNKGTQPIISVPANKFVAIGNPYASPIKIANISKTNILDDFYVWDPALGGSYGLGAYQVISRQGAGYEIFPGGGSYGPQLSFVDNIESGQAFFVRGDTANGELFFEESDKGSGSNQVFFTGSNQQRIRVNLFALELDSSRLVDAVMVKYDTLYNDLITNEDIVKVGNSNENLSIQYPGTILMIEKKQRLFTGDTIFLKITGFRQQSYQWAISTDNLECSGARAFIYDRYLQVASELSFSQMSSVNFQIDDNVGSYSPNRFLIFFKEGIVLPITDIKLDAKQKSNGNVEVAWEGVGGTYVEKYELDKSRDGIQYFLLHTAVVDYNSPNESNKYQFFDNQPIDEINFYRVKVYFITGSVQYSDIVKIQNLKTGEIFIYPNPVKNSKVQIWFKNQPKGNYLLLLSNISGQKVLTQNLKIDNSSQIISVKIPEFLRNNRIFIKIINYNGVEKILHVFQ